MVTSTSATAMQQIVKEDKPELLVNEAEKLAEKLTGFATTTQIRRLFATFRQIEMSWPRTFQTPEELAQRDNAYRELILFGPRLEYQTQKHEGLRQLAEAIKEGIKYVDKDDRKAMQRLGEFFEAVVAYAIVKTEERSQERRSNRREPQRDSSPKRFNRR